MLHHCQPTVVGRLCVLGLILDDVVESELLILLFGSKYSRARERRHHRRLPFRGLVVTLELVVGMCIQRLHTTVGNLVCDLDRVAAPAECIDLHDFHVGRAVCLKA